ncbi:MAG: phenylacetate--CoA ligase [Chloroflexi bacterium RBG_16_57_8]|nr:MAG: phenylacetate--CoA ligase [Chloroflexi bacterium RBG_16_57_8]
MADDRYWNPVLETMPREKLRDLQFRKFQRILRWAYDNSPFYRRLYREAGLEPGDVKTFEDIRRVPKTDKSMLREIQARPPFPYGDILAVPLDDVTEFRQTSGTTGQPVYHPETWQDWEWSSESWAYALYAQGYRKHDRIFMPFGYSIFIAFWAGHYAAEKIGCEVVPGGVLDTEARVLKIQELKATAVMATPTYILGMADTARKKLGIDPAKDLWVRKITAAGETGACVPATKKRMEEAWGAKVYDQVGATEIGHWGFECQAQCGEHILEAFHLVEIEDVVTGAQVTKPGGRGSMVVTTFDRLAHPCIRFDSKDVIELSTIDGCECGRTFRLLNGGVIGRADDITKVKGVLLAPTAIEEVVRSIPELGDEYQVVVTKKGDIDEIALKAEVRPDFKNDIKRIEDRLVNQLRLKTGLRYDLSFHDYGTLPRYALKSKRFIDLRKHT